MNNGKEGFILAAIQFVKNESIDDEKDDTNAWGKMCLEEY